MSERATVFESCRLGVNPILSPTADTDALKKLQSISLEPKMNVETSRFRPYGSKYDTQTIIGRDWSSYAMTGRLDYTNINYVLASVVGDPTITTPGGATNAREWEFESFAGAPDLAQFYTIESGSTVRAQKTLAAVCTDFEVVMQRTSAEVSGTWLAQLFQDNIYLSSLSVHTLTPGGTVSGGTFTLTSGTTTAALDYDVTNDEIRTALAGLASIGSERNVTVLGGPVATAPVTVIFGGSLEGTSVPLTCDDALLTGAGAEIIAASVQAAGALSTITGRPVRPGDISVYVDTDFGDLGTSKELRVHQVNLKLGGRQSPIWVLNDSETSWANVVETEPDLSVTLKMQANGAGMAYLNTIRDTGRVFIRVEAVGPEIESGQNYLFRWDMAADVEAPSDFGNTEGSKTVDWIFRGVDDADFGGAVRVLTRSGMTAL